MEQVVPSALQHLRATDIIRMAGLAVASLGQEYCRTGAVHGTYRQGALISGVVDVPLVAALSPASSLKDAHGWGVPAMAAQTDITRYHYAVEVELHSASSWQGMCSCGATSPTLCAHAAALLYQWLARPLMFAVSAPPHTALLLEEMRMPQKSEPMSEPPDALKSTRSFGLTKTLAAPRGPAPLGSVLDILTQMGLSELRGIAREYEIVINGMNKQQLAEAIVQAVRQPEAVRRVAGTLEKPQRQLLAALTLAGGSMTDDEMRGLFERFSLGLPGQLQSMLIALQSKGLLLRTSLNSSLQQRIGLSGALLDIGWYVPAEVRAALRASVPITPFDVQAQEDESDVGVVLSDGAYSLLADLLLIARALDGYKVEQDETRDERVGEAREAGLLRASNMAAPSTEGSTAIPAPADMPATSLLESLQELVDRPLPYLRFAVGLLRYSDILHRDDGGTPFLRALPNAAQTLLGPTREEVLQELFELWLTQPSYESLFELREEALRLRCRATTLNHPIMRPGELEAENSEARQTLVALLAQVPQRQWINFTAFSRFVYRLNPLFLQKRQRLFSSPHWWMELEAGRPLRPLQMNDWLRAEAHYLARLIRGPLFWWGACDIVQAQDGKLLAFRLTPLAGRLFHGMELVEQASQENEPIRAAAALEIVNAEDVLVTCEIDAWPAIEVMELFAEVAGVHAGRLRYRLTPKALGNALSHGNRPDRLLALLRAVYETPSEEILVQLLARLERWSASYGRVRVYTDVALLETADTVVMRELSATTSLGEQVVQSIHPTLHILKRPGAERLIDDLKRRGQAPLLHDEEFLYGSE